MKLGIATIEDKEYYVCLSMRVLKNLQDRTGNDISTELKSLQDKFDIDKFMPLLHDMLIAGAKQARRMSLPCIDAPELEDLYDMIGIDDFGKMFGAIRDVVQDKPELETVQGKNAKATEKPTVENA